MSRRADSIGETRQRIVEATVHLHSTVGPAHTTIAGIAEQANVTRLTVYRHFPDEEKLFAACSAHWLSQQDPPDPARWAHLGDPPERLREGLTDLYRFYRAGAAMLRNVYRDRTSMPVSVQRVSIDREATLRALLVEPIETADRELLEALAGHATSYWTWRSLCIDHGLPNTAAVDAMVALILTAA
jgi:AcrR family transcriptional regulator